MLTEEERRFLTQQRAAHLATADRRAVPHVVPVCHVLSELNLYITIDEKPKAAGGRLKRLRNIDENPSVAFVADHYSEDWAQLGWVMLHGRAEILRHGAEHAAAQALLRQKYPQLRAMDIALLPVIAIRIARVVSWGDLSAASAR
jgi:PPOX class probable F420-dependent enzyme